MASNASTRLNALDSGNNVQSETVDSDMADPIVGAIKGGFAGGFSREARPQFIALSSYRLPDVPHEIPSRSLDLPGSSLGFPWAPEPWAPGPCALPGPSLGLPGLSLGLSGLPLGPPWALPGPPRAFPGPSPGLPGPSWALEPWAPGLRAQGPQKPTQQQTKTIQQL